MVTLVVVCLLLAVTIFRMVVRKTSGKSDNNYLLVSLFIQTLPFAYGKSILTLLPGKKIGGEMVFQELGAFGNSVRFELPLLFFLILLLLGYRKWENNSFGIKDNIWFYVLLVFSFIAVANPSNIFPTAALPLIAYVFQFLLIAKLFEYNFSIQTIIKGLYDGLKVLTILNLFLAICYPVLNIGIAATLFKGEHALEWAQRRAGYASAVGIFGHPGPLALFSLIAAIYFLACSFNSYNRRLSKYLILANMFVILLTFSRTTYISSIIVFLLLFVVHKQKKQLFSVKNILIVTSLFALVVFVLYLTPLSDVFLKTDAGDQIENRYAHWILGYDMWNTSKLLGIGMNTHVYYMSTKLPINLDSAIIAFLIRSPIHNIHMIILAETGLLGIFTWLYFYVYNIGRSSKRAHGTNSASNILRLTYTGVLSAFFIYGTFGWTPFQPEIFSFGLFIGYFATSKKLAVQSKRPSSIKKTKPAYLLS